MHTDLSVVGIGNAIVDVLSREDESFLSTHRLNKGGMTLIDDDRARFLRASMSSTTEMSGGSCANTMVCSASLGGKAAYIGKVRDDELGRIFADDLRASGVVFRTAMATDGPGTGRSLIVVTPDGERTMNTCLGACAGLRPEDVDEELVSRAKVVYLTGHLWDSPRAVEVVHAATATAHSAGRAVAVTLSDVDCVDRHAPAFREAVANDVDILFANEAELAALTGKETVEEALGEILAEHDLIVVVTRSGSGSTIASGADRYEIPAKPSPRIVDTTGAGDAYAAGFLHGYTRGCDLPTSGRLGAAAAAEIVSHLGARPRVSLARVCAPVPR